MSELSSDTRKHARTFALTSWVQAEMETLITKPSISRLLSCDPRAKILRDLSPVAYLLNGRTKKELFPIAIVDELKAKSETESK